MCNKINSLELNKPKSLTNVILSDPNVKKGFPGGSDGKESSCNAGDLGLTPGLGQFPWRREWQPTLVCLPGESHGQRSLVGDSPWGHKELDVTEVT